MKRWWTWSLTVRLFHSVSAIPTMTVASKQVVPVKLSCGWEDTKRHLIHTCACTYRLLSLELKDLLFLGTLLYFLEVLAHEQLSVGLVQLFLQSHEHWQVNPFTAVLATLSLKKWPIEVPNFKWLQLFTLFNWAHERTSRKMHSIESRFVRGPSNMLFAGMSLSTLQPGNFTSWGSEGVNSKD